MSGPSPYPYQVRYSYATGAPLPTRITTSRTELFQLSVAFLVLTVDFALILGSGSLLQRGFGYAAFSLTVVAVSALSALTAFVAHEMAHKIAAQRLGAWAEFRVLAPHARILPPDLLRGRLPVRGAGRHGREWHVGPARVGADQPRGPALEHRLLRGLLRRGGRHVCSRLGVLRYPS